MIGNLIAFTVNPIKLGIAKVNAIAGDNVSGVVVNVGTDVTGSLEKDYVYSNVGGNVELDHETFAEYVVAEANTTLRYDHASILPAELSVGTHESTLII